MNKSYLSIITPKQALIAGGLLITLFFLFKFLIGALLMVLAIAAAFMVVTLNVRRFGIELVTFASVLIAMAHGPIVGAIVAFILICTHLLIGQFIDIYVLWVIPGYVLGALIAGIIGGQAVTSVGLGVSIGLNILFFLCTALINPSNLTKQIPNGIGNVIVNWGLFTLFAPIVFNLMA